MKKNSSGFSLVELVVVIAIMVILSTGAIMGFSSLGGQQVRRAARSIDTLLSNTKNHVMAKGDGYMIIEKTADGDYIARSGDGTEKSLGTNRDLVVTYTMSDAPNYEEEITEGAPLIISYEKASGRFTERVTAVNTDENGVVSYSYETGAYVKSIIVRLHDRSSKITLFPKTGKHKMDGSADATE